jgi:hypothetical protein
MSIPSIAIINFSSRPDQEVQTAIRAVNRQIQYDFMPIWGQGRELRLYAASFEPSSDPDRVVEERISADSVLYLVNESTLPGALGYHSINTAELPVGFVFTQEGDWTITLSHEALELILDPNTNAFVPGPHPHDSNKMVLHCYEACDAVERASYSIDGVPLSDFLTPQYFQPGEAPGTRNDFLGVGVKSFGVIKGSHIAFIDLATGKFETVFGEAGPVSSIAAKRLQAAERDKPRRPSDEQLAKLLAETRERLGKRKAHLAPLRGITRTSRYRASAELLRSKSGARPAAAGQPGERGAPPPHDGEVEQLAKALSAEVTKQLLEFERRRAEKTGALQ